MSRSSIHTLEDMFSVLQASGTLRLVVAYGHDAHTLQAVSQAVRNGLVRAIVTGDKQTISRLCRSENIPEGDFEIIQAGSESEAADLAVALVKDGKGDMIMKGTISTDRYMRAILNKEKGILPKGALLTHVSVLDPVKYPKLLIVGDVAIIPLPGVKEKVMILKALISTAHALGIAEPKVALIAATEQALPGMQACVDAAVLAKMAERGQIKGAVVDGPMALDVALDAESARIKKVNTPVAGNADCLLFPNIESGNVFYKCHTKLLGGEVAAVVHGASVPAILSSRGDSIRTKLFSIALAAMTALNQKSE